MSLPVPAPYDAAASYRNFGQELLRMIQSGQITPERANQLKADVYAATKLGNTAQGQQAMNAAIGAARDALPMKGYDPAAMYRNIGSQLSNAVKSGQMTVQQAQALQAPLFAAVKLGNTAPGYAQMNSAYNSAISAIRNASPAQPQGGLTQATAVPSDEIVVSPNRPTAAPQPVAPQPVTPMLGNAPPVAPAPTPTFDRNAALQQLNQSFANLRNTYGVDALRGAGFAPSNLSALQADLRKLQLDSSSTQAQHTAALQNALNTMNSYTNNLKPVASPQPGMALSVTPPQPMPAPTPAPVQGMALGGLMAKYRGGMC